jgi:5'-nucleotidase
MRVLVTNDDGIRAPGLMALRAALLPLGEVVAIAPERPRSACGHAITLHKPLRLMPVDVPDGGQVFAINGFPADCVALGASEHLGGRPDVVVSGINVGPNLGVDMVYSGTVAAAREAAICGISSFAISIVAYDVLDFGPAAEFALELTRALCTHELPAGTYLNVNEPAVPRGEMEGVAFTRQGRIRYDNRIERRTDPRGGEYYWLTGDRIDRGSQPEADVEAVDANRISITPAHLDVTEEELLADLRGWDLKWPA